MNGKGLSRMGATWPRLARNCAILIGCAAALWCRGAAPDSLPTDKGPLLIHPIQHATLALQWNGLTLLVDPVAPTNLYSGLPKPDIILITDIHPDHLNPQVLTLLAGEKTQLVAPEAAAKQLPSALKAQCAILANGQSNMLSGCTVQAIPAYNTTQDRQKFHSSGRGNGYVLGLGGKRIYISGDTEDTPEMKALTNIDVAFVCMNLPYTMDVSQAASAVKVFKPKIVYPYHYRGSDLQQFKKIVEDVPGVEVRLKEWYPGQKRL